LSEGGKVGDVFNHFDIQWECYRQVDKIPQHSIQYCYPIKGFVPLLNYNCYFFQLFS